MLKNRVLLCEGDWISDKILMAQEIVHSMGKHGKAAKFLALHLDMERAYVKVHWDYLQKVLLQFGFHSSCVSWILFCYID